MGRPPGGPSRAAGSEEAASPAEATAGSAGLSLLSWPAQRPEPTTDLGPLTLWILFRAIVGGGWRQPPGRGRGQGRDGEGVREREAASVIKGRPEKMESPGARVRRDRLRAEAHSAPEPAAAVTASPGGGPFMRCCLSRRRRGSCLFLFSSAPPPQQPRIPPPRRKSPGLRLRGASWSDSWRDCLLQVDRGTRGRTGGRRRRGGAARERGGPRPRGRSGGSGIGGPGGGGQGRGGGGGIRAAPVSILRAVAVAVAATAT